MHVWGSASHTWQVLREEVEGEDGVRSKMAANSFQRSSSQLIQQKRNVPLLYKLAHKACAVVTSHHASVGHMIYLTNHVKIVM